LSAAACSYPVPCGSDAGQGGSDSHFLLES
jgi:hypothetical protein